MDVPESHPRHRSLMARHRLEEALSAGYLSRAGLIAHGRGEAFDYLLGETTSAPARVAIRETARWLVHAKQPVLSINGNVTALVAEEYVELARTLGCPVEINLFYRTEERIRLIDEILQGYAAAARPQVTILGQEPTMAIPGVESQRGRMDAAGMAKADVVLVPLEDGDRCEGLVGLGKRVISIDLNPMSRTAQSAHLTIVDELTRCIALLRADVTAVAEAHEEPDPGWDNAANLRASKAVMKENLDW